MKKCTICKIEKHETDYKKTGKGYFYNYCKGCHREKDKIYRRNWRVSNTELNNQRTYKYAENNPEKVSAQKLVRKMVKLGKMKRSSCEVCGNDKVHGHHPDYSQPLYVKWLCPLHHAREHAMA